MASTMLESHLVSSVTLRVAAAPRNSAASASASATAQAVPCKALGASSSTLLRGGQLRTGFVAVHRRPCTMAFRPRAQSQGDAESCRDVFLIGSEEFVAMVSNVRA